MPIPENVVRNAISARFRELNRRINSHGGLPPFQQQEEHHHEDTASQNPPALEGPEPSAPLEEPSLPDQYPV